MGKFTTKLSKLHRKLRCGLVVGSAFGNMDDLLDNVPTIFSLYPKDTTLRRKNLIYRESIGSTYLLGDIDIIVFDKDSVQHIPKLEPLWKKCSPILVVEGDFGVSMEFNKFLKTQRYQIVEVTKTYHVWKMK